MLKRGVVSVIVPIYNSATCLPRCIESIRRQTYKQLQILLINDGSTDESGRICDYYANLDSRIEVYHLENNGVSKTRNFGLSKVQGEYIQFVDSDDYISHNMTRIMVQKLQNVKTDMVVCNYVKVFQNLVIPNMRCDFPKVYSKKAYFCKTLQDAGHHYYGVVWNKLYRRDIIEKYQLSFHEEVSLGEDFIFNIQYWMKCQNVAVINKYLYHYNKSNDLTLSQSWHKKIEDCQKGLKNRKYIYKYYVEAFQMFGFYDKYKEDILFYWIVFYIRQKNSLRNEYGDWTKREHNLWESQIENDTYIVKSLQDVSKGRIYFYERKYLIEKKIKSILKRWGGIVS